LGMRKWGNINRVKIGFWSLESKSKICRVLVAGGWVVCLFCYG
jgi:hypothetical protein